MPNCQVANAAVMQPETAEKQALEQTSASFSMLKKEKMSQFTFQSLGKQLWHTIR